MIDDLVSRTVVACREIVFRDRHADAIGESLAKRTGRRLHPRRQSALGVSRSTYCPIGGIV